MLDNEEIVKNMFKSSKKNKNLQFIETPWNLIKNVSKPSTKFSRPKLTSPPIANDRKFKKKLYMKERWITKRLYDFIQSKLQAKYGFYTLAKSEEFIIYLAGIVNIVLKNKDSYFHVSTLKTKMAQLEIVTTHDEFHNFIRNYLPFHFRSRAIPACGRDIPDIEGNVYDNILKD